MGSRQNLRGKVGLTVCPYDILFTTGKDSMRELEKLFVFYKVIIDFLCKIVLFINLFLNMKRTMIYRIINDPIF